MCVEFCTLSGFTMGCEFKRMKMVEVTSWLSAMGTFFIIPMPRADFGIC